MQRLMKSAFSFIFRFNRFQIVSATNIRDVHGEISGLLLLLQHDMYLLILSVHVMFVA